MDRMVVAGIVIACVVIVAIVLGCICVYTFQNDRSPSVQTEMVASPAAEGSSHDRVSNFRNEN
jgi:hypothetical protein